MPWTITLPRLVHRNNELIGCHWATKAKRKRQDRELVTLLCRAAAVPPADGKRRVSLVVVLGPRQRLANDYGECRINPPTDGSVKFGGRWPLTLADQFCGCWRPLPVVQGKPRLPVSDFGAFRAELSVRTRKALDRLRVDSWAAFTCCFLPIVGQPTMLGELCEKLKAVGLAAVLTLRAVEGGAA